ncbi:MAG: hypothetical protein AAFY71_01635 [Bacteroidota bacterium]
MKDLAFFNFLTLTSLISIGIHLYFRACQYYCQMANEPEKVLMMVA